MLFTFREKERPIMPTSGTCPVWMRPPSVLWMKSSASNAGTPFSYAVQGEDNELLLFNYKDFDLRIGGKKK